MGSSQTKYKRNPSEKDVEDLRKKLRLQQEEIHEMMCMRESESQAYEQEMMVYALKEAAWKKERKRLREERKRLKTRLEEREERIRGMEDEKANKEWHMLGTTNYLEEQMREERARRDEAVEKWKRLYLAIKIELDNLITRTHQGERMYWRVDEEELQRELKVKEETIELLQEQLASMEQQISRRDREVDILRQSLRIMSHTKKANNNVRIIKSAKKISTQKISK